MKSNVAEVVFYCMPDRFFCVGADTCVAVDTGVVFTEVFYKFLLGLIICDDQTTGGEGPVGVHVEKSFSGPAAGDVSQIEVFNDIIEHIPRSSDGSMFFSKFNQIIDDLHELFQFLFRQHIAFIVRPEGVVSTEVEPHIPILGQLSHLWQ